MATNQPPNPSGEFEEVPRLPTVYENGFSAGYDGEDWPDGGAGPDWARGWKEGRDAWEQEADLAERGKRALEAADETF